MKLIPLAIVIVLTATLFAYATPATYILVMALLACLGIGFGTGLALSQMGFFGWLFFGNDLVKGSLELCGVILSAAFSAAGE